MIETVTVPCNVQLLLLINTICSTFEEFIIYLGITAPSKGEQDPKKIIEVTFLLYDADGDGHLTSIYNIVLIHFFRGRIKNGYEGHIPSTWT